VYQRRLSSRNHFFELATAADLAFCTCFLKPLAILPAAVPNNEFTFPLATIEGSHIRFPIILAEV
jgi:hypothetical protein